MQAGKRTRPCKGASLTVLGLVLSLDESAKGPTKGAQAISCPLTAAMSSLRPETTLPIAELFRALDLKVAEQISLARSVRPGQNPFSHQVLQELDSGAQRLLVRLEELKNSHQPIQQLPPDVILTIATYLNPRTCGDCQPLMAMSQVCRYWRESLLSNWESWSFVSSEYIELLPVFLERSGSYPLEINLDSSTLLDHIIQRIEPHTNRLASLRCDLEEANIFTLQSLSQFGHSPSLHTFSIKISRPPTDTPEVEGMVLFLGDTPALRTLELFPFPLVPQFRELKRLVDLRLDVRYSTLTAVLDLLSANPSLERVRLLGNFNDDEDVRPTGSISMRQLRFLAVERCTPCLFLEKLTFPRNVRIFIRYNYIPHLPSSAYALPRAMRGYTNLQGMSSLHALMTYPNETYVDVTGPHGSVALQYTDLQNDTILSDAIDMLSVAEITHLTCEFHPTFVGVEIGKVVTIMDILPHLEEIVLVHFGSGDMQNFLSALRDMNRWMGLRRLKFVHCHQIADWISDLIHVALERESVDLMWDTVTIVDVEREPTEWFGVLEGFVGTLEIIEEEAEQVQRSVRGWDEANCTATRVSVPAWDD
ncbi:hypothetical protein BJ322DRAFT_656143 [Thelephora terrestris]|uniref:F-box domain-containing protein n=1 Tax=Thelephora terrestris TaxID=56493 RepID=A0A9P6HK27_9AGAM|nr:hypothetical protein BJ322DRAFT_656143 [Thelephora terrestris]